MGIEVIKTVNEFTDYIGSIPPFGAIAKNPLYTALMITLIIMIIVALIVENMDKNDSFCKMYIRIGYYVFFSMTVVMLLHNRILIRDNEKEIESSEMGQVFDGDLSPADINIDSFQ